MVWVQPWTAREPECVGVDGAGSALNRTPKWERSSLVLETSGRVKEKQQLLGDKLEISLRGTSLAVIGYDSRLPLQEPGFYPWSRN